MKKSLLKNLSALLSAVILFSVIPAGMSASAAHSATALTQNNNQFKKDPVNIVLTMDLSASMNTGNKLQNLKKAATAFVDSIFSKKDANYKIALVTFNSDVEILKDLEDFSKADELKNAIKDLKAPDLTSPKGFTNMQKAINEVTKINTDKKAHKYMVLISDGVPTLSYKGQKASPWILINFPSLKYLYRIDKFDYDDDDVVGNGKTFSLPNGGYSIKGTFIDYSVKDNGIATISEALMAKDKGWTIFSIGCNVNNDAKFVLYNCASTPAHYISANERNLTTIINNLSKFLL